MIELNEGTVENVISRRFKGNGNKENSIPEIFMILNL
jgi:hypothetical protein